MVSRLLTGVLLLLAVGLGGCQQIFLHTDSVAPAPLKSASAVSADGGTGSELAPAVEKTTVVATVTTPELPKRLITLTECIALALENGRTGAFFDLAGTDRRSSVSGLTRQASPATSTDSIRVFAFDPAILATEIEQSLSRFDTVWQTGLIWDRIDKASQFLTPNPSAVELFTDKTKLDNVGFRSMLLKPLPTGGLAGVNFFTDYSNQPSLPGSDFLNPTYRPGAGLIFEQPLLRGAGVDINQLLDAHPGSPRYTLPPGGKVPGIMLTRLAHTQAKFDFERQIHELVFKVEEAYWGLYAAYWELYSRDNALKQTHAAWQIAKARFDAGGVGVEDVAMIEEQYQFFRTQRLEALGQGNPGRPGVLEAERRLRYVIGLPAQDTERLVPADEPTIAPLEPNWEASVADARRLRPEFQQINLELRAAELNIAKARNLLQPDLRFLSKYDVNGLDNNLGSSIGNLANRPHHEWELGLQLEVPIGFREAHSEVYRAKYLLAQRLAFWTDQQAKLLFSLQRSYRDVVQLREEIQARRSQRQAAATQLKARYEKFKAGGDPKQPDSAIIDLLLRAQRNWADAVRDEYQAICNYNVALADFERQRGTILRNHNVAILEGDVPACACSMASRHIGAWTRTHLDMIIPSFLKDAAKSGIGELPPSPMQPCEPVARLGMPAVTAPGEQPPASLQREP